MGTNKRWLVIIVGVVVAGVAVAAVGIWALIGELDPGDKGDETILVDVPALDPTAQTSPEHTPSLRPPTQPQHTPTATMVPLREFAVAPDESRVDFLVKMQGLEFEGVFPIREGQITLEPVGRELRVYVYLEINVDEAQATELVTTVLRGAMKTGDYPIAYYAAQSQGLVPVTEDEISFELEGELQVHHAVNPAYTMTVQAQLVRGDMWAVATAPLDLTNHGVELPDLLNSGTIQLTAHLAAYQVAP